MLSILIPEYNCDCTRLVRDLSEQCIQERIDFEILVLDDASPDFPLENHNLSFIPGCVTTRNEVNVGQASCRNRLAKMARFPWLLFLDSDLQVQDDMFIKRYLEVLGTSNVVSGGLATSPEISDARRMLRWKYGRKRECIPALIRNQNPWKSFFSSNMLIEKSVIERIPFDEQFKDYGHEDTIMGYRMKGQGCSILHIDNPLLHLGIDLSDHFLAKSLTAVEKYFDLPIFQSEELVKEVRIFNVYRLIVKFKLDGLVAWKFGLLRKMLRKNLLGSHPSLFWFDFYRLGYLCQKARLQTI